MCAIIRVGEELLNIEVVWHKTSPVFRRDYCVECGGPVTKSTRGRPRQYCSAACRQHRYRDMKNFHSKEYHWRREDRAVERVLRKYERAKGKRIDGTTPIIPGTWIDRRSHLTFGLRDGRPMEYCLWCGVPMLRDSYGMGYRRRCCSRNCRRKFGEFVRQVKIALMEHGDSIDPVVRQRLRMFNFKTKRILPPIRSKVGLCEHCHKPFAATHPARKYCGKRCRQNAWYAAHMTCAFCKRRFRRALKAHDQKYCSRICHTRGRYGKPPLAIPRICVECGAPFVANRQNYTGKVYCSRRCYANASNRRYRARKKEQRRLQKAR